MCFGFMVVYPVTSLLQSDLISVHSTRLYCMNFCIFFSSFCLFMFLAKRKRRTLSCSVATFGQRWHGVCLRALPSAALPLFCQTNNVEWYILLFVLMIWKSTMPCPVLTDSFSVVFFHVELLAFQRLKTPLRMARR